MWLSVSTVTEPQGRLRHKYGSGFSIEFSPNEIAPLKLLPLDRLILSQLLLDKTHIWIETSVPSVVAELSVAEAGPRRLRRFLAIIKTEKI